MASVSPAGAQPAEETARVEAIQTLEACLNAEGEPSPQHGRTCIGAVSGPCMREPGGESTIGMVLCLQGENRAWRALAELYSRALRARETSTQTARLENYLAESENWRRARCAYHASLYEGGSLSGVIGEDCANEQSALVAIDLHGRVWDYDHR